MSAVSYREGCHLSQVKNGERKAGGNWGVRKKGQSLWVIREVTGRRCLVECWVGFLPDWSTLYYFLHFKVQGEHYKNIVNNVVLIPALMLKCMFV